MRFEIIEKPDSKILNIFQNHRDYTLWHSAEWCNFLINIRRIIEYNYFVLFNDNNTPVVIGIIQIGKRANFFRYGIIQAGFLIFSDENSIKNVGDVDYLINELYINLTNFARKKSLTYIYVNPVNFYNEEITKALKKTKKIDFNVKAVIPQWTNIIDLTQTEETILSQMKPKGRYNIKVAEKNGVEIFVYDKNSFDIEIMIEEFYKILLETTTRDGFRPNNLSYYKNFINMIPDSKLIIAKHNEDILAGGIFTYTKNQALYYYGASSNIKRNMMAPYLVQWKAIQIGKEAGCKYYDFMGIADPNNPKDRLIGVTEFKLKFSSNIVKFLPSHNIITHNFNYFVMKKLLKK